MGNSYSVVREEQEEAEFRRLVDAVEIAQQRSTRQDDLESGLALGYPLLGSVGNGVPPVIPGQFSFSCMCVRGARQTLIVQIPQAY